jgi:hypothetical protein
MQLPAMLRLAHVNSLRELVSLRELARTEQMSRYKLSRLLTAVGIAPVYQHGKALYFDRGKTHEALQARLHREREAVSLAMLSISTGVSGAVLARKVRRGIIRALGHGTAHLFDAAEAERIEQVVRAVRSTSENLETLGICRIHTRGRAGAEVAGWT